MQLLWLSALALGVMAPRPACSYRDTLPLVSLKEIREAVPIGTPSQQAQDTLSLAGFECVRTRERSLRIGTDVGIRYKSAKYIDCMSVARTAVLFKRTVRVRLVIVEGKVSDVQYSKAYNYPYDSKPYVGPTAYGRPGPWGPNFMPPIGPQGAWPPPQTRAAGRSSGRGS